MYVEVKGASPHFPPCLRWGSLVCTVHARLTDLRASGNSPVSTLDLTVEDLGLQMYVTLSGFYLGSGQLNSGPPTCEASALPIEPSPQCSVKLILSAELSKVPYRSRTTVAPSSPALVHHLF